LFFAPGIQLLILIVGKIVSCFGQSLALWADPDRLMQSFSLDDSASFACMQLKVDVARHTVEHQLSR
jgi:hypothetical protein